MDVKPIHEWPDGVLSPFTLAMKFNLPLALAHAAYQGMANFGYLAETEQGNTLTVRGYHALTGDGIGMAIPHIFLWDTRSLEIRDDAVYFSDNRPMFSLEETKVWVSDTEQRTAYFLIPFPAYTLIDLGNLKGKSAYTGAAIESEMISYWYAVHHSHLRPVFLCHRPFIPSHGRESLVQTAPPKWAHTRYDQWKDTSPYLRTGTQNSR